MLLPLLVAYPTPPQRPFVPVFPFDCAWWSSDLTTELACMSVPIFLPSLAEAAASGSTEYFCSPASRLPLLTDSEASPAGRIPKKKKKKKRRASLLSVRLSSAAHCTVLCFGFTHLASGRLVACSMAPPHVIPRARLAGPAWARPCWYFSCCPASRLACRRGVLPTYLPACLSGLANRAPPNYPASLFASTLGAYLVARHGHVLRGSFRGCMGFFF
jgi:hypothetical protein